MPRENFSGADTMVDPFYPDGYVSTDQDRMQILAQKKKYAASVNSINLKFPLKSLLLIGVYVFLSVVQLLFFHILLSHSSSLFSNGLFISVILPVSLS